MYAQEVLGLCPDHLQEPFGKILNISFIGFPPFITSDFVVTKILGQKFHFTPKYIPATSWDITSGTVHLVSFLRKVELHIFVFYHNILGIDKTM